MRYRRILMCASLLAEVDWANAQLPELHKYILAATLAIAVAAGAANTTQLAAVAAAYAALSYKFRLAALMVAIAAMVVCVLGTAAMGPLYKWYVCYPDSLICDDEHYWS